ncbi:uncharacterized protein LODBEIA_P09130 [Lodderomyces beijingensis]|uniref:protein-serine/threonine phosphatase n=1 Tax=Lodderomyces beijingensis TaxID=1775926 RepID=A0ABP0ZEV8_9ASCO
MGQILSQPVTDKDSASGSDRFLAYGFSSMQGWRVNMEDDHATILDLSKVKPLKKEEGKETGHAGGEGQEQEREQEVDEEAVVAADGRNSDANHIAFFGVYDGHGGEKAALFAGEHLHHIIKDTAAFKNGDYINALRQGFLDCDQAILKDVFMRDDESGCAATSAIITPKTIACGNAGDSRTIMSINGYAKALSYDHKPANEGEKTRITAAGGYVDMGRVNGNLALSRGLGDFDFKKNADLPAEEQIVTCYPDVILHNINFEEDEFVILACDGIWDCLTSQKCVECVRRGIYDRKPLTEICEELMELCCAPTSDGSGIGCDNMSIIIVALLDYTKNETLEEWTEKIIKKIELAATESKDEPKVYGPISQPYSVLYKEMYGDQYEIGQHSEQGLGNRGMGGGFMNGNSIFGQGGYDEEDGPSGERDDGGEEDDSVDPGMNSGAISLSKLLSSNAITKENGVIYLDTSSAQSLLAHFGVGGGESSHREDIQQVEEVDDEDDDSEVHSRNVEEDDDHDDDDDDAADDDETTNSKFEEVKDEDEDVDLSDKPKSD